MPCIGARSDAEVVAAAAVGEVPLLDELLLLEEPQAVASAAMSAIAITDALACCEVGLSLPVMFLPSGRSVPALPHFYLRKMRRR